MVRAFPSPFTFFFFFFETKDSLWARMIQNGFTLNWSLRLTMISLSLSVRVEPIIDSLVWFSYRHLHMTQWEKVFWEKIKEGHVIQRGLPSRGIRAPLIHASPDDCKLRRTLFCTKSGFLPPRLFFFVFCFEIPSRSGFLSSRWPVKRVERIGYLLAVSHLLRVSHLALGIKGKVTLNWIPAHQGPLTHRNEKSGTCDQKVWNPSDPAVCNKEERFSFPFVCGGWRRV
jgi:hypothetical protein